MFRFTNIVARTVTFKLFGRIQYWPVSNLPHNCFHRFYTDNGKFFKSVPRASKSGELNYSKESKQILDNILVIVNTSNFDKNKLWKYVQDISVKLSLELVASILFQMSKIKINISRIPEILLLFTKIIETSRDSFNAKSVGDVCYGLRLMTSDNIHVRRLVNALSEKVNIFLSLFNYNFRLSPFFLDFTMQKNSYCCRNKQGSMWTQRYE